MPVSIKRVRAKQSVRQPPRALSQGAAPPNGRMVVKPTRYDVDGTEHAAVDFVDSRRVALMITPCGRGPVREQVEEAVSSVLAAQAHHGEKMSVTVQTVFLRSAQDRAVCEAVFSERYGAAQPLTNYVIQPPCCGAALAIEAWTIGGSRVTVQRFGKHAVSYSYDGVRWVHCGGIQPSPGLKGVYPQTMDTLRRMSAFLREAGTDYQHVVRTWFYLGGITSLEGRTQRYQELNRARSDFYHDIPFCRALLDPNVPRGVYPASTGIGMRGHGLVLSSIALETRRDDVFLLPLENPQQTPAYAYHPRYSPKSPKFSRAMALVLGDYVTTWISGTASIVDSETCHAGDPARQTEQTIDNIERLIAAENFAQHGVKGAGATLRDLAKIRVYLKRAGDFEKCREICQRRFGPVPAVYAVADVCRSDLLVEIEGVAFSRYTGRHSGTRRP